MCIVPNQISCCLDCVHPIDESGQCLIAKMFEKPVNPEHGCSWRIPIKRKAVLTNADRIRQMTVEELAEFFCQISQCCGNDAACSMCPIYDGCAQNVMCVERWLKQEVSEDAGSKID